MLSFFARTLTRREMALGCAVLSLALLLSTLPAALRWGQAQLDTGALLCADTLRFHIRADSDSPADQTVKLAVRDAVLAYADVHCTAQDKPAALRWAAENLPALELTPGRAGKAGDLFHRYGTAGGNVLRYHPLFHRHPARRAVSGPAHRPGRQRPPRQNWWCVLYPGLCRSACGTYALPEENDLVCGAYVVRFKCVEWWQRVTASREDKVLVETASPSQARSKDGEGKTLWHTSPQRCIRCRGRSVTTMAIPAYYSLIQKGSYGPDEALVQTWLNGVRDQCSFYPALTTDGRFGTKSENAVKEFQLRNNMNMDGKVGANTWNVLYAKYTAKHGLAVPYPGIVMRTGMSGGTIRLIQQKLNTLGEKIGTDGKFGSRTAAAVQRFQRRNGLNADGAAGKATWEKLFPAS